MERIRGCVSVETKETIDSLWPTYHEALNELIDALCENAIDDYKRGFKKARRDRAVELMMAGVCTVIALKTFKWYKDKKENKK